MKYLFLYAAVLLAYVPGLVALVLRGRYWQFPILSMTFLGMLVFNAIGSIGVFATTKVYWLAFDTSEIDVTLALVLIFQVLAFYVVCGLYIAYRNPVRIVPSILGRDFVGMGVIASAIVIIGSMYYVETGTFLIFSAMRGDMNIENAFEYRDRYIYGLRNWPIYNLAFVFLPVLLSTYAYVAIKTKKQVLPQMVLAIVLSIVASLSMGSKGGIINFVMIFGIANLTYLGMSGAKVSGFLRSKFLFSFTLIAILLLMVGYQIATPGGIALATIVRLWYRIFVAYPEGLAAGLSYVLHNGELGVAVFPTLRGLLPHHQENISMLLHQYASSTPGGISLPFAGEAFMAAGWMGVVVLVPLVFAVLLFIQEAALRLKGGLVAIVFSSLYGYLAVVLATNGMFASLFNLMYPGSVIFIGSLTILLVKLNNWVRCRHSVLKKQSRDFLG